ncbi:hypothetical protein [Streptomyces sp. SAI-127]|nr:hypothetical protein [Streptomyces sp. SAI-127]MDH6488369.1 hypothetical protein [Streptomyces sp. SAI-127]
MSADAAAQHLLDLDQPSVICDPRARQVREGQITPLQGRAAKAKAPGHGE